MHILPFRQLYIPLIIPWKFPLNILKPFIKLKIFILIWMFLCLIISEKNVITEITEKKMNSIQRRCLQYTDMLQYWTSSQRDYTCLKFWIVWTWFLSHELIQRLQKLCNPWIYHTIRFLAFWFKKIRYDSQVWCVEKIGYNLPVR